MTEASLPGRFEGQEEKASKAKVSPAHRDRGCKGAKRLGYDGPCVGCPFPKCLEDGLRGSAKAIQWARDNNMAKAIQSGKSTKEVAEQFGVTQRTVERAVRGRM